MAVADYVAKRRLEIAQNIRRLRRSHGWTQEDVAQYLGCSRRRANRVEQGHVEFFVAELELLARAFNVPLSEILGPSL